MATYVLNGQSYELPDELPKEQALQLILGLQQQNEPSQAPQEAQQAPQEAVAQPDAAVSSPDDALQEAPAAPAQELSTQQILDQDKNEAVDPDLLVQDRNFLRASQIYYYGKNKEQFKGSEQELVDWSLSEMSQFNYNLASGAVTSYMLRNMSDEEKASFGYLLDTTDKLEYSWAGAGRAATAIATDPTTYVGLGSFGLGFAGKAAGKVATKEAVKAMLRPYTIRSAAIFAASEGAVYGAAGDAIRQSAEVQVNEDQEFSMGRMATAGAIGAAGGGLIGGGVAGVAKGAAKVISGRTPETPNLGRLNLPEAQQLPPQTPPGTPSVMPETAAGVPGQGLAPLDQAAPPPTNPLTGVRLTDQAQDAVSKIITKDAPINVRAVADNFNPNSPAGKAAMETATKDLAEISKVVDIEDFQKAIVQVDPDGAIAGRVMEAVRRIAPDGTVANLPSSYKELRKVIDPVIDQLTQMQLKPSMFTDVLARAAASPEQTTVIKASVNSAANLITEVQTRLTKLADAGNKEAADTLQRIAPLQSALADLDSTFGSASGSELGYRAGGLLTGENKGLSIDNILFEQGISPDTATMEQFNAAASEMTQRIEKRREQIMKSKRVQALNVNIDMALKQNDLRRAMDLMDEVDAVQQLTMEKEGLLKRAYDTGFGLFNEAATAGALSTGTLAINMIVPTIRLLTQPAMKAIFKGGGEAARKEAIVGYTAMLAAQKRAWATFKMFLSYDQQIFREAGKETFEYRSMLPSYIFQKQFKNVPGFRDGLPIGAAVNIIPKLLGASDQYIRLVLYESEVAAEAAYNAVIKAQEKGLKGKAKKAFIEQTIKSTSEASMKNVAMSDEIIRMFRMEGIKKGLTGDALAQHVRNVLDTKGHLINEPTNKRIMDTVIRDTFGKAWDDKGLEGILGAVDKQLNNRWKAFRTIALFLRPTYMIFKYGLEVTPVAQMFIKQFRDDILGRNGHNAATVAQMKMFAGYAMMLGTMGMAVNGQITGSVDSDYKKLRNMRDAGIDPYTMQTGAGFGLSYRNLDPISTPMKMTANFMEAMAQIETDGMLNPHKTSHTKKALEMGGAALYAFIQAVADANLGQGFRQAGTALEEMFDPEGDGWKAGAKFLAEKVKTVFPSTPARILRNPQLGGNDALEPRTWDQTIMARVWPTWEKIPRSYDFIGKERKLAVTPLSAFSGIDFDRTQGTVTKYTEVEQAVITKLNQIEQQTGSNLTIPTRREPFDQDLREIYTSEGITFQDAWNREIQKDPTLVPALYRDLVQRPDVPVGNKEHDAYAATRAKQLLSAARKAAWERLVAREFEAQDARNKKSQMEWLTGKGLLETPPPNMQLTR